MKTCLFLLFLFHVISVAAQDIDPLAGRTFAISLYEGKERDSNQALKFNDGKMTFSEAEQYGFVADSYKWKQKNDSTWTFLSISKSSKNGIMTWEGKVTGSHIEGTCIWSRKVENPVNYTFKGSEISK